MEWLARADDSDCAGCCAEPAQPKLRDIGQLEAVVPIRITLDNSLVQLMQRVETCRVERFRHDNCQINVTDVAREIAADQRTV